jgi:hypothetical protein
LVVDAAKVAECSGQSDLSSHTKLVSGGDREESRSEMAMSGWRRSAAGRAVSLQATLFLWLALAAAALTLAQVLIHLVRLTPARL